MSNSNVGLSVSNDQPVLIEEFNNVNANANEVLTYTSGSRPTMQSPATNTAVTGLVNNASAVGTYGLLAMSNAPEGATADALINATNVFYGALVYIPQTVTTTKFLCDQTTAGTSTVGYAAILQPNGTTVVATANQGGSAFSATTSWSTSTSLTAGYYYVGIAMTLSVATKFAGYATLGGVTLGNGAGLVYAAAGPYPKYVTSSSTVTISSSFPTSVTLAAQSSLGVAFFGIF